LVEVLSSICLKVVVSNSLTGTGERSLGRLVAIDVAAGVFDPPLGGRLRRLM